MSETSGNASIGSVANAATPPAMNSTVISATNSGWCRANATMRLIMPRRRAQRTVNRSRAGFRRGEQLLEQQDVRGHDPRAGRQPALDRHDAVVAGADVHLAPPQAAVAL